MPLHKIFKNVQNAKTLPISIWYRIKNEGMQDLNVKFSFEFLVFVMKYGQHLVLVNFLSPCILLMMRMAANKQAQG